MRMIALGSVAVLLAAAPGGRTTGPAASYLFGGRIIAADSGSLDGVHVIATDERGTYEALIDSSGTFVGAFPAQPSSRVTLRVFSDSAAPRYYPSVVARSQKRTESFGEIDGSPTACRNATRIGKLSASQLTPRPEWRLNRQ